MKKILLVLAMVAASAFMAQPAIAADDVPTTSQDTATDPPVIPPAVVPPVVPPVVVPPVVEPPVVPPVVVPPVVEPPATDPPAADPAAADPAAADPPAADLGAPAAKLFNTPEICPVITGLNSVECPPTCDQTSSYTKGKYCHPQCDDKWSPSSKFKSDDCNPRCDDKWSPSSKFKGNDCHPRCDDKWKSSKFKGGDKCHHPRCDDHKHGRKHSRSDDELSRSSFNHDKKGHGKHRSHCPRPPKCETHDKKHDHKSWGEHSDDKPSFKNMKFSGDDWSHSGKRHSWDKKHKHHKDHCSTPKEPSNPSDPGSTSGVLPDTGGAPLWVLMMGGLITAAGVTVLVRGSPAVPPSDSAGGGR